MKRTFLVSCVACVVLLIAFDVQAGWFSDLFSTTPPAKKQAVPPEKSKPLVFRKGEKVVFSSDSFLGKLVRKREQGGAPAVTLYQDPKNPHLSAGSVRGLDILYYRDTKKPSGDDVTIMYTDGRMERGSVGRVVHGFRPTGSALLVFDDRGQLVMGAGHYEADAGAVFAVDRVSRDEQLRLDLREKCRVYIIRWNTAIDTRDLLRQRPGGGGGGIGSPSVELPPLPCADDGGSNLSNGDSTWDEDIEDALTDLDELFDEMVQEANENHIIPLLDQCFQSGCSEEEMAESLEEWWKAAGGGAGTSGRLIVKVGEGQYEIYEYYVTESGQIYICGPVDVGGEGV